MTLRLMHWSEKDREAADWIWELLLSGLHYSTVFY